MYYIHTYSIPRWRTYASEAAVPRKRPAESSALRPLMADGLRSPLEKMNEAAAAANGLSEAVERR